MFADKRDEATSKKGAAQQFCSEPVVTERVPISDRQEVAQIIAQMIARRIASSFEGGVLDES